MTRIASEVGGGGGSCAASSKSEKALHALNGRSNGLGGGRAASPFSLINSSSNR